MKRKNKFKTTKTAKKEKYRCKLFVEIQDNK